MADEARQAEARQAEALSYGARIHAVATESQTIGCYESWQGPACLGINRCHGQGGLPIEGLKPFRIEVQCPGARRIYAPGPRRQL